MLDIYVSNDSIESIIIYTLINFCFSIYLCAILYLLMSSGQASPFNIRGAREFKYSFLFIMKEYITVNIVTPIPNIVKPKALMSLIKFIINSSSWLQPILICS